LLVKNQTQHIAIELKYKTKKASISCKDEQFDLCNQSAQDIGRYDFLKDIQRIENYVTTYPGSEGYAILLTNDQNYWKTSNRDTVDAAFRIHEGRQIQGKLEWRTGTSKGTMRSRETAITIEGSYVLNWKDFSQIEPSHNFRYVLVYVPSKPKTSHDL